MTSIYTVNLPDIGEGVVEGEVIQWLKKEGDPVGQDEPVVIVMTDKATVELPSPYPGSFAKRHVKEGDIAIKGRPLYSLEVEAYHSIAEKIPSITSEKEFAHKTPVDRLNLSNEGVLATPPTRHLAKELRVSIEEVSGSGKDGRVTEEDIILHHAGVHFGRMAGKTAPLHLPDDEEMPMIGRRHLIAEKMLESKHAAAEYSYFDKLDATRLVKLRDNIKNEARKYGFRVTYMPFIIKALSKTIEAYPLINGSVDLEHRQLLIHKHHDIGIAINHADGLMVSVLRNVQQMSLHEVIKEYDLLLRRVEEGKIAREELVSSTITVTNFGTLGGLWATPIINYPEIAILGIAKIRKQPAVREDAVVVREMMNLSWTFDHRAIDGGLAAKVSNKFISLLENPASLL